MLASEHRNSMATLLKMLRQRFYFRRKCHKISPNGLWVLKQGNGSSCASRLLALPLFVLSIQVDFIKQELGNTECPVLLVGHSIGSYISLEVFRRSPEQVKYCIGLYPFLSLNGDSSKQIMIGKIAGSQILSNLLSSVVAVLGLSPSWASRFLVRRSLGKSWSTTAVEAVCGYLLQYHVMRNVLFMAMTEFKKLAEAPDWMFMRGKQDKLAFLFGIDDHWGPLSMFEEVSDVALSIEKEGHTHAFCCTEAGSEWVADHVVNLSLQMPNQR